MELNIYLISHPIIKLLSNSLILPGNINKNTQHTNHTNKSIGKLLIYEIMRKYIKLNKIYVKQIINIKQIHLLDKYTEYYIITDLSQNYYIAEELKNLLPSINIVHIDNYKKNTDYLKVNKYNNNTNTQKEIIIFNDSCYDSFVIEIIENLQVKHNITINSIHIACITCYNQFLDNLRKIYPKITIYTTKIIY